MDNGHKVDDSKGKEKDEAIVVFADGQMITFGIGNTQFCGVKFNQFFFMAERFFDFFPPPSLFPITSNNRTLKDHGA